MEGVLITVAVVAAPILTNKALVWADDWWKRRQGGGSTSSIKVEGDPGEGRPSPAGGTQGSVPQPQMHPPPTRDPLAPPEKQALTPILKLIIACLVLHTIYILTEVILNRPTNMFTALQVPVTTPVSQLRARLEKYASPNPLPPHLEFLLKKFNSFDTRGYYVRFGHEAIASCVHCTTQADYLMVYMAHVSLEYVRMAMLLTVMTMRGSGKRKWRQWGIASAIGCWGLELWQVATVEVSISRKLDDVIMWHERIWALRHLYFLVAPLVLWILPYSYVPLSPLRGLPVISAQVDELAAQTSLLTHLRTSIARSNVLREQTNEYWKAEAEEAHWGRSDEMVRRESERLGMGYADLPEGPTPQLVGAEGSTGQENANENRMTPYRLRELVRNNLRMGMQGIVHLQQQSFPQPSNAQPAPAS